MARACPGCAAPMKRETFGRKPLGTLDLDLCLDCQAIWFDAFESPQLTPNAVQQLFREIDGLRARTPRPLGAVLRCVTCHGRLALTHDIQRTNRLVYYRCPEGHGRFTTFLQFLREKDFVRSLAPAELRRLAAAVGQVRCSSCGAPVDIARDDECRYCHAPISILDVDAVRRALDGLDQKPPREAGVDPDAMLAALLGERPDEPPDLVHGALHLLSRHL
ncbi:MAG TPA: hypothetical protein VFJ86_05200 [Usitatibacter sp.]|jgi:hypothetical protein|nr:hypothetical protein [Usitatibacter sp.]